MKKGTVWMAAGLLMIMAAFGLMVHNQMQEKKAEQSSQEIVEQLAIEEKEDVSGTELPEYKRHPGMEMPSIEIDGNGYIGILKIPAYNLELPVMSELSYPKLRIAPCRYKGSVYEGDLIIAAHNYSRHFGQIKNLIPGDEVIFWDTKGNCFTYEVADIEELAGTAVEEMEAGEWDLTLFTCTYGGRTRVTVRCVRVD